MRAVALGFLLTCMALDRPAWAGGDLPAQLEAAVALHFPSDQPGATVLVRKGDRVLLRKGFGRADLERALPMQPEMVLRLGSITKQFTATAIMMLVDAGRLSLRDDLHKLIPAYPDHGATITVEHLLTHTSGIPSYTDQPGFVERSRKDLTHEQLLATFKNLALDFPPGTQWKYSNSGYYLLGMIIEKISGQSYADFVADKIFKPLGMVHTGYGDQGPVLPGGVRGYQREGPRVHPADVISMKLPFAAGALVSSLDDLARWDTAIAAGKLLDKGSWQRVFAPMKLSDGSLTHYGYGWGLSSYEGHRVQSHVGGIPGFNSAILRMPDDQLLVVILCNSLPASTPLEPLALALGGLAIGKPVVDPAVVKIDATLLDRCAGVYTMASKRRLLVRRAGDHLTVQAGSGPPMDALPSSDTTFFVKGTLARFTFVPDTRSSRVTGVELKRPDGTLDHGQRSAEALPEDRTSVAVDAAILEGYVGGYQLGPGFVLTVTRAGTHLYAQATNQPRVEIFASSPTEFFVKVVDAQITFYPEGAAHAPRLVLHQGGRDVVGKRVP